MTDHMTWPDAIAASAYLIQHMGYPLERVWLPSLGVPARVQVSVVGDRPQDMLAVVRGVYSHILHGTEHPYAYVLACGIPTWSAWARTLRADGEIRWVGWYGTTFDFGDGNGPVAAHQHPNGGGWVADTATVTQEAYVGPEAKVYGYARVYGGHISDRAQVYGYAEVHRICGIGATYQLREQISGDAEVCGQACVSGNSVRVRGFARVGGFAKVRDGVILEGNVSVDGAQMGHGTTYTGTYTSGHITYSSK